MDFGTGINPIWAFVTAIFGGLITYFTNKNSNDSTVEIAKIQANRDEESQEADGLRIELAEMRDSYIAIKEKYKVCLQQSHTDQKLMADYRNLIRHYKFIFKLIYKQIIPHLDADSPSFVLMEEVKEMFREDFTL